jgi:hypothetical protein
MPFGRHRGQLLTLVPADYLRWAVRTCDLDAWLRRGIEAELERRAGRSSRDTASGPGPAPSAGAVASIQLADLRAAIKGWFAGLAIAYHPDRRGGDGREMAAINIAAERLRKALGI